MPDVVLGPLASIPPGEGRNFDVSGQLIAIFHNRAGQLFAVQANCPHKGGPLADGLLGDSTLVCPLHSRKFDLTTGAALVGECGLETFPVWLDEGNQIVLKLGK
jgi:nitrite reductase [NAD(P)H] small subunit